MTYYILIRKTHEVKGPYSEDDLLRMSFRAEIPKDTPVCKEGTNDWVTLFDVVNSEEVRQRREEKKNVNPPKKTPTGEASGLSVACYFIAGLSAIGCLLVGVQSSGSLVVAWLLGGVVYALIWVILGVVVDNTKRARELAEQNAKKLDKILEKLQEK